MGRAVTRPAAEPAPLSAALFVGFAAASIGGPLALLTLLPGTVGEGVDSAGPGVALALGGFAGPPGIGPAPPRKVLSPGGPTASPAARDAGLLLVCASLPLYLGAEVSGGRRTVRRGLTAAVAIVGAAILLASLPLTKVPAELRDAAVPGAAIAQAYGGRGLAIAVGLLTAGGTLALIVAEYLALARLLHWLHGPPVRTIVAWIAVPFVAADAISLLNPDRFYNDLLKPSLGALFVSQLLVFLVFPRFRRSAPAIVAAAVASGLAGWGLYTLIAGGSST